MKTVFENELHDMTAAAKEVLLDDEMPWQYRGHVLFEEVPYFGYRTDLVTARFDTWDCARRKEAVGHLTPLPDERKFRQSYRALQRIEPITRNEWIHEDSTYRTEQTCREVWDWLADHAYLAPCRSEEVGGQQRLPIDAAANQEPQFDEHTPAVTVKFPDVVTVNAFELKQRDWETALRQAIRADSYADFQWVVMDAGHAEKADENGRKQFSDAGVGLLSLDQDGFDILAYPETSRPPNTKTRQLVNERALEKLPDDVCEEIEERRQEL